MLSLWNNCFKVFAIVLQIGRPILSRQSAVRVIPKLVVLVDFKAIYPGVPPGIFASFPGVAHFLSFEQICQYPRVSRKSTGCPGNEKNGNNIKIQPNPSSFISNPKIRSIHYRQFPISNQYYFFNTSKYNINLKQ
jgi:hypothetical protein